MRRWPDGWPRLDNGPPDGRKKGRFSFIHDGHWPRLHRLTKWAHSNRNAARATTYANQINNETKSSRNKVQIRSGFFFFRLPAPAAGRGRRR